VVEAAWAYLLSHPKLFRDALVTHLTLSGSGLAIAAILAVPLGILLSRSPRAALLAINAANIGRTVPSLAVLAIMLPVLGTGFLPSLVALTLLAIPPILINSYVGIRQVDPDAVESAVGMGMTRLQVMAKIELPVALPVISAGVRTAAVQVVAGATLAAFIGGGGLGDFITSGIALMQLPLLLLGAVPIALLAIGTELLFYRLERVLTPRGMRSGSS